VTGGPPDRLADVVREDYRRWSVIVQNAGITLD
jgi:hypothetical protein